MTVPQSEARRAAHRRFNLKQKARALEKLGGAKCLICGCESVSALEVNHIHGGGRKEWLSRGGNLLNDIVAGRRSAEGLNVLCRPCNAADYIYRKYPKLAGKWEIRWVSVPSP